MQEPFPQQEIIWNTQAKADARTCARLFAGTPHHNRLCVPGTGVDCIHFVMAVLQAARIVPPEMRLPAYDDRIGRMREWNIIEDILTDHLHAERTPDPEFGAIIVCRCGRETNHVGIIIDGDFWHTPGNGRCGPEAFANWRDRTQAILRITAPGLKRDPQELTASGILAQRPG